MSAVAAFASEPVTLDDPFEGMTVEPGLGDPAAIERAIAEQNLLLAQASEIPEALTWWLGDLADEISSLPERAILRVDPYLLVALQRSLIGAMRVLDSDDSGEARRHMRIRLEQIRQVFRDMAEGAVVFEDRPSKDLARWLAERFDTSQTRIAALFGISARTFQRWVSGTDPAAPEGEELRRLRVVASLTNHLRHALTGPGVLAWFERPNPTLDGRQPVDLLVEPNASARLRAAAASARSHTAS